MLEIPDVPDESLRACLHDHFGVCATEIAFLPLGNDVDTAVYQVVANDATPYFLKLRSWRRSGRFDATTVTIPRFLHDQGITQIIASIPTRERQLWACLDAFAVILFPFIAGRNGFAAPLSERQWIEFGAALKKVHTVVVPPTLNAQLPYETYAPLWRDRVRALQVHVEEEAFTDPIAAELAAFLCAKHDDTPISSHAPLRSATRCVPNRLHMCCAMPISTRPIS